MHYVTVHRGNKTYFFPALVAIPEEYGMAWEFRADYIVDNDKGTVIKNRYGMNFNSS